MIVAERKQKVVMDRFDKFGEKMPDGRLTARYIVCGRQYYYQSSWDDR